MDGAFAGLWAFVFIHVSNGLNKESPTIPLLGMSGSHPRGYTGTTATAKRAVNRLLNVVGGVRGARRPNHTESIAYRISKVKHYRVTTLHSKIIRLHIILITGRISQWLNSKETVDRGSQKIDAPGILRLLFADHNVLFRIHNLLGVAHAPGQ